MNYTTQVQRWGEHGYEFPKAIKPMPDGTKAEIIVYGYSDTHQTIFADRPRNPKTGGNAYADVPNPLTPAERKQIHEDVAKLWALVPLHREFCKVTEIKLKYPPQTDAPPRFFAINDSVTKTQFEVLTLPKGFKAGQKAKLIMW